MYFEPTNIFAKEISQKSLKVAKCKNELLLRGIEPATLGVHKNFCKRIRPLGYEAMINSLQALKTELT